MSKNPEAPQPKRLSKRVKTISGMTGLAATGLATVSLMPALHAKRGVNDCAPDATRVRATDIVKVRPPFYNTAINAAGKMVVIKVQPQVFIRREAPSTPYLNSEREPSGKLIWFEPVDGKAKERIWSERTPDVCVERPQEAGNPMRELHSKDAPTLHAVRIVPVITPQPRN